MIDNTFLMDVFPSTYLFSLISSEFQMSGESWVYNEEYLIDSFSSDLVISDTLFTDIELVNTGLKLTSSNVTISNLTVSRVTSEELNPHFIFLNLDSRLTVSGINFVNNGVPLMNAITSVLDLDYLVSSDVT